jgi:RNA polymerase sigma-70 factor (ECF subfamily)
MTLDDSIQVEDARRAASEHRALRGAAAKLATLEAAFGADTSDLVRTAAKGEQDAAGEAFARLVDRYWARLVSACYGFFPNVEEARDVARDVCLRIWFRRSDLDPSKKFESFLMKVARNYCIDLFRKDMRHGGFAHGRLESTDAPAFEEEGEGPSLIEFVADPHTLEWEQRLEIKEAVEQALKQLSPVDRFILIKRFDEGYSRAEIGKILAWSEQNIGIHERSARELFKNYFSEESKNR